MSVFGWLNDQLLRMTWLNDLVGAGVAAIGLDPASRIGGSVQFFVYDVIKIFILLSVLIFAISWVQSHFPPERTRAMLGGRSGLGATTLAARTEGVAVEVSVREGEAVRAGQVLARLEAADLQERVNEQAALVATERARLALARQKLEKQRELYAQNFISKLAFDELDSNFQVSQAQLRAQEAQLARARKALEDTVIRAPFAGVIHERAINLGQRVAVNGKLFALADLTQLEIAASVPARQIARIAIGQRARFTVEGGAREFAGQVARINPVALAGTRSFNVFIAVDNRDGQLRGGQFAQGALLLRDAGQALSLPIPAIRDAASAQPWVLKLVGDKAVRQAVTLGVRDDAANRVQIVAGLQDGERVLLAGVLGVQAGDRVQAPAVGK
jgi:RND family efflux transporter MFP subunit